MPCARVIRSTILAYERTANGYALTFGNWLVLHTTSQSEPFIAHK